jgi:glycosidase
MTHEAVFHRIHPDYFYAVSDTEMRCRIRVKRGDCSRVAMNYRDIYKNHYHSIKDIREIELDRVATDMYFDYYEGIVPVDGMISIAYYFVLQNHTETVYYGNYHFHPLRPEDTISMFETPVLLKNEGIDIPAWAREAIVYEIFPERFADGNPALHPPKISPWYAKVNYKQFIGGNIPGITGKLDYLKDLGINTIYLTPVFYSDSTHKYDTFDYFRVDPHFGTNDDLAEMVREAHARGIRVILDAVFNHCGTEFFAFRDVVKKGEASLYKKWFDIKKFPVEVKNFPDYKSYAFMGKMPKLATWNPDVREYFYEVGRFWIRTADIDGWRLDVAPEIDRRFWRGFRDAVKSAKPDALIVGEVWHNASMWLEGDQFDTNMNYPFLGAMSGFFGLGTTPPSMLDIQLGQVRGWYRQEVYDNLWNLIGSHDTARFMHICGNDPAKMKAAVFFQMTYTGAPMILYGDEAGMNGDHEFCRLGMVWDDGKRNGELYEHYRKAIALRKKLEPLRLGETKTIIADDERNIYGFSRAYNGNKLEIYINNSEVPREITLRADKVYDHWNEKEYRSDNGEIVVPIAPKEGVILSE